jgi:hypothetical protein
MGISEELLDLPRRISLSVGAEDGSMALLEMSRF